MNKLRRATTAFLTAFSALAWVAVASVAPAGAAQAPSHLSAAFGALPQSEGVTLSSSGRMLAWIRPDGAGEDLVVFDLASRTVRRTVRIGTGLSVDWLRWEGDDTLLVNTAETQHLPSSLQWGWGKALELSRVLALDVATGKSRMLLADQLAGASGYLDTSGDLLAWDMPGRPHTVVMSATVIDPLAYRMPTGTLIHSARGDSGWVSEVFSVDTGTGQEKPIAYGDAFTNQWVVDADGNVVARSDWRSNRFTIYAWRKGAWRQIYERDGKLASHVGRLEFDAPEHALVAVMMGSNGRRHLWEIPLDGSAPKRMLPAVKGQVRSVAFDTYDDKLASVWVGHSHPQMIWLDPAAKIRALSVSHAFPGRTAEVYDDTRDGQEVLAEVQDAAHPPIYYLVNFATHHADIAGEAYPQLAHVALGTVQAIQYQTKEGLTVHAQLFLPQGGSKDLPLVVLAPGGPEGVDPNKFDWFAQYLAARGYAVLRPDIELTGLPTIGGPVLWGGLSQRYAVDGVHQLVKQGVADAHRVCIVGVGYGGYAALAGAAFSNHTYACAVSINGISDLPALLGHERAVYGGSDSNHLALVAWHTHLGSRFDPKVISGSPVHAADLVLAPVLLIHSEDDTVVPVNQSLEMKGALERAGRPVAFIQLKGSDHWLSQGSTRVEVLKDVGAFLGTYLH